MKGTAPNAKSLVLDLLSTLKSGSMPVRALIAAAELFGIDSNTTRVALARLVSKGLVDSDERGEYRLGRQAAPIQSQVAPWRTLEERTRSWSGAWLGVALSELPRSDRTRVRTTERALRLLGFERLQRDLAVRPDNLREEIAATRRRLHDLGLDERTLVFELRGFDAADERRARSLWDTDTLVRGYQRSLERIEASARRLPELSESEAIAESFLLGGSVIRQLVLDPMLPAPIIETGPRTALVAAMIDYDKLGRRCWAPLLRRHGLAARTAPLNSAEVAATAGAARAAGALA